MNNDSENFNINQLPDDQCIIANKVCDLCTKRDCLSPIIESPNSKLVDSARSCESNTIRITGANVPETDPGDIIEVPADTDMVTLAGKFSITQCKVISIEPASVLGRQGYWRITVNYKFTYPVKLFSDETELLIEEEINAGEWVAIDSICACTSYQQTVVLFGGEIGTSNGNTVDIALCNTLYNPCGPYSTEKPFALVQAEACLLKIELGEASDTTPVINATIGLFTIIKTYRIVNMLVQTTGNCLTEEQPCEDISDDPCEYFNSLDFPFEDFDPECPLVE